MRLFRRLISGIATVVIIGLLAAAPVEPVHGAPTSFTVYIGFDNGPIPYRTDNMLDVLAKYSVKATFFIEGNNIHLDPQALQREIREGHHIGSHLWEHSLDVLAGNRPDPAVLLASYQRTDNAIHAALGDALWQQYNQAEPIKPFFWPGLAIAAFPKADVITYNPSVVGGEDSPGGARVSQIVHSVLYGNQPDSYGAYAWGDGAVIMMHDTSGNDAKALPAIITSLRAHGAIFATLPRPGDTPGTMPIIVGSVPPCAHTSDNCATQIRSGR